jgi:hypothetical protein
MKLFDVFLWRPPFEVMLDQKRFDVLLHKELVDVFLHKEEVIEVHVPVKRNADGSYFVMEDVSTPFISEDGQTNSSLSEETFFHTISFHYAV